MVPIPRLQGRFFGDPRIRLGGEIVGSIFLFWGVITVLEPMVGRPSRLTTLLAIGYWGHRRGVLGGVASALGFTLIVNPLASVLFGLEPTPWKTFPLVVVLFTTIGWVVGRMSDLGRRLRSELAARERAEAQLLEEQEAFRVFFEHNPHPMWIFEDESLRFVMVNQAQADLYGYTIEEFGRMTLEDVQLPENLPMLRSHVASVKLEGDRTRVFERRHRRKDGAAIDIEVVSHRITYQGRPARLGLSTDVTEQKRKRLSLEFQANHDALTGLPNRASFEPSLDRTLDDARRSGSAFSVFLMDLDRFKAINDTLGHSYGDLVLQQIGPRLYAVLRTGDILARLGGDEFALILPGADLDQARQIGDRLMTAFDEPFTFEGQTFDVGASVGSATHPDHGEGDAATLIRLADLAMYAAKREGGGVVAYDPAFTPDSPDADHSSPSASSPPNPWEARPESGH